MQRSDNPGLSRILLLDAATCLMMGLALTLAAGTIGGVTGLPAGLLRAAGAVLFPVAAFMALVAYRGTGNAAAVRLAILGNAGWVVASLLVLAVTTPTAFGIAFVLAQAVAVAGLAWLEASASAATA